MPTPQTGQTHFFELAFKWLRICWYILDKSGSQEVSSQFSITCNSAEYANGLHEDTLKKTSNFEAHLGPSQT